jgi:hypothetical protein
MPKHHVTTYDELVEVLKRVQYEQAGGIVPYLVDDVNTAVQYAKPRKDKKKCCHCPKGKEVVFCGCNCHKVTV